MKRIGSVLGSVFLAGIAWGQGFVIVSDSYLDRVLKFDSFDGHLIDNSWIPSTRPPGGLGSSTLPLNVIDSGRGTLFVSDQVADAVFEFSYEGVNLRTIADLATNGINNVRGIAVRDQKLYVTVAEGLHAGTVQEFDLEGPGQRTFAALPSGASPWDVTFRTDDALVSDSGNNRIHRVDLASGVVTVWHASDPNVSYRFPDQIHLDPLVANGVLVGGFSLPNTGVYSFAGTLTGTQLNYWPLPLSIGARGAYRLGNGKILWSSGTEIQVLDPATGVSTPIPNLGGDPLANNFRFIEFVSGQTLSGQVGLQDYLGAAEGWRVAFELRDSGGAVVDSWMQKLGADGAFVRSTAKYLAPGTYSLRAKGGHWLAQSVQVQVSSTGSSGLSLALPNGDIDGDNAVTVFDYNVLSEYFDKGDSDADWTTVGPNGWAPVDADLDGDGTVTVFDYNVLSTNFDLVGDA